MTKNQRSPTTSSRAEAERERVLSELAELAVMWPRLEAALARDGAGPSAAPLGGTSAGQGSPAVLDLDTQDAMVVIETDLRQIEAQVVALLGLVPAGKQIRLIRHELAVLARRRRQAKTTLMRIHRSATVCDVQTRQLTVSLHDRTAAAAAVTAMRTAQQDTVTLRARIANIEHDHSTHALLEKLPDWYDQMRARQQPLAEHIGQDVHRWYRVARSALKLSVNGHRIGWQCPHHRDQPAELVRVADQAKLHPAVVAGKQPRWAAPLKWERAEAVRCPHCGAKWSGAKELRVLMKMIEQVRAEEQPVDCPVCGDPHTQGSIGQHLDDEHDGDTG